MTNSFHDSDLSSSYSVDSLEIPSLNLESVLRPSSKIPLYRGEANPKFNLKMPPTEKNAQNGKIQKKTVFASATNRSAPVFSTSNVTYPKITIKHYHNDKVYEKIIPAVDGKNKPKKFLKTYQYGDTKGLLRIKPLMKNRSYLEIFQARNGYKTMERVSNKSTDGEDSPRVCEDGDSPNLDDFNDTSSFFLNLIDNVKKNIQYTSQASSHGSFSYNSEPISRNSSMVVSAMTGLESLSENLISTTELTPKLNLQKPQCSVLHKKRPDSTQLKMDRYLKQRQYGQLVSNMNRLRMEKNKTKTKQTDSSGINFLENDLKVEKLQADERTSQEKTVFDKSVEVKELPKFKAKPIRRVEKDLKESKNIMLRSQVDKPTVMHQNIDARTKPTCNSFRSNIKTLQDRHMKEKLLIEKLRHC